MSGQVVEGHSATIKGEERTVFDRYQTKTAFHDSACQSNDICEVNLVSVQKLDNGLRFGISSTEDKSPPGSAQSVVV